MEGGRWKGLIHRLWTVNCDGLFFEEAKKRDLKCDREMRFVLLLLALVFSPWAIHGQDSSQARLDAAEGGSKDVAWPRKPDNRLSNLSGKMKDFREIPNQEYGGDKEFRAGRLYEDRKESSLASVPLWSMTESKYGAKNESTFNRDARMASNDSPHRFDPVSSRQEEVSVREEREIARREAADWSSRSSRMGQATDGTIQMYEGRLTRVRQQVNRDAVATDRDLGEGRREKYSPEEVQKILQQQPGLPEIKEMVRPALPVRAESPVASRPLAAGS